MTRHRSEPIDVALQESAQALTTRALLELHARENPDAVCLLAEGGSPQSYGSLRETISELVDQFRIRGLARNDRVALVLPNGPELATAFLAVAECCAAVPLNPQFRSAEFESYFAALGVSGVLVQAGIETLAGIVARRLGLPLLTLLPDAGGRAGSFSLGGDLFRGDGVRGACGPEDLAVILHTSGTTGRHKTVPLTHENICRAAVNICSSVLLGPADRCLNVMPLHYIHGLSALLSSIVAGGSIVCTPGYADSKFYVLLEEFRPTWYTASPTIHQAVFEEAAAHRDAIVRHPLRFIRSASSAMPVQLIEGMEKEFGCPFIEAYGMTETSPQVASNGFAPGQRRLGSVGKAAGPEVAIMDDAGALLPAGKVGEIVVRGATVMRAYENDAQANASAFANGWFRTGDLGYLDEEEFLFVTGRRKEMINRGGEKIYPREIDEVLMAHPAVAEAAAFAVPHPRLGEEVAVAVRLRTNAASTGEELRKFAASLLADYKVPRQVIIVDEIPKSGAGKIQRRGLAELLGVSPLPAGGGNPEAQHATAPRDELEWKLCRTWEKLLRIDTVGVTDNFFDLGGHSILAVSLFVQIEKLTGKSLPLATLLEAPTVEQLAKLLRQEGWRPPWSSLVPIQPAGANPPLFCAHGGGGNVLSFEALSRHLGKDQPLYGLQSAGLDGGKVYTSVAEMAEHYLRDILTFQPDGPYFLEGMSFGGLVALEMAHELKRRGKKVALLALLDTYPKGVHKKLHRESIGRKIELRLAEFLALESNDKRVFLENRRRELLGGVRARLGARLPSFTKSKESQTARNVRTVRESNMIASARYEPQPYHGRVTIFWARESFVASTHRFRSGWNILAPDSLEMIAVPGSHITMFEEPNVQVLAREIARSIRTAQHAARNDGES